MKKRNKKKIAWGLGTLTFLAIGLLSFAFYNLLNTGVGDILLKYGIDNFYYQNLFIVGGIFVFLILVGFPFYKILDKMLDR